MTGNALQWDAKTPQETLDYVVDWSDCLEQAETLATSSVVFENANGCTFSVSPTYNTTKVIIWLTGGTAGTTCQLRNNITTSQGRVYSRKLLLPIQEAQDS